MAKFSLPERPLTPLAWGRVRSMRQCLKHCLDEARSWGKDIPQLERILEEFDELLEGAVGTEEVPVVVVSGNPNNPRKVCRAHEEYILQCAEYMLEIAAAFRNEKADAIMRALAQLYLKLRKQDIKDGVDLIDDESEEPPELFLGASIMDYPE